MKEQVPAAANFAPSKRDLVFVRVTPALRRERKAPVRMSSGVSTISPSPSANFARTAKTGLIVLFSLTAVAWFGSRVLLSANFLPHWYCYVGNKRLLWSNVIADLVIGVSYVVISGTLALLVRRAGRNLPYSGFFWAFGLFIVSCGATHFMEIVTVWKPIYWMSAAVKIVTAAASAGTAVVLLIAADDIVGFVHTAREAAARRGDERFRALVEAAPMGVISSDLNGNVVAWNPAAEHLFGWTAAETIGKKTPIVPVEKEQQTFELHERSINGEVTTGFETVRVNRTGTRIPVSISVAPVANDDGKLVGLMGVYEDISERKRFEQELKEKTAVLGSVTQAINTFLGSGDWNAASRHLLAFAVSQTKSEYGFLGVLLDDGILRVLARDGATWDVNVERGARKEKAQQHVAEGELEISQVNHLLEQVIAKRETVVTNVLQTAASSSGTPSQSVSIHSFLGVPIFKGSETVGLIGVANRADDYTERELRYLETMCQATGVLYDSYRQNLRRKGLEEEQKRLESQVRQSQKMEVLGRLAGGVAHDFNNMLMVLGGCSELLDRSLPAESPARMYLDQIQRTTEKAAAITKQLLAFSRKQVVEFRPMDLHEALGESEFMLPRLLGSDIELTFHHNASQSWILSDPSQIEQVVANLGINSRDAMPQGGRLTISTRNTTRPPEDGANTLSNEGIWLVLEVKDTGLGMDEKTRTQIFEPFFTTKPAGKGTGLGLATVYGIVKQCNGFIRVDTAPGKGTCFELYFPAIAAPVVPARNEPSFVERGDSIGSGETILVADDEAALRHAVVEILRSSGYRVLEAQTATEALEIAQEHRQKLDILLTDVVMPGLRGPELARRVAKMHPDIRVVYMSGYAEGFPETQLPDNSTFLQKPFRFATLLEQLKLIRRRV